MVKRVLLHNYPFLSMWWTFIPNKIALSDFNEQKPSISFLIFFINRWSYPTWLFNYLFFLIRILSLELKPSFIAFKAAVLEPLLLIFTFSRTPQYRNAFWKKSLARFYGSSSYTYESFSITYGCITFNNNELKNIFI